jgi:maleate isomerase
MALGYAPKGLLAVLVPQANTTVEAEMRFLVPPDQAWIAGRLTSNKATIEDRLRDYLENYGTAMAQFANAPVAAAGFACTGASYLLGRVREDELLGDLVARRGHSVHTAATAIADALAVLGATRIALVSPYDDKLTKTCEAYWATRGFEIVRTTSVGHISREFHPIYSLESDAATRALETLEGTDAEAVVLLGTGLPTLRPILARPTLGRVPVISSNLCLTWRLAASAVGELPSAETLLDWTRGTHHGWGEALRGRST